MRTFFRGLYWLLVAFQCLIGLGLIYIITIQESKNDGLSGQIGSTTSTSSFKGKAGRDEQLTIITKNLSVAFFALSVVVAYGTNRWE